MWGVSRPGNSPSAERLVADSAGDQKAAAFVPARTLGLPRIFVFIEINHGHVGALLGEGDGDGAADAACRTGLT